MSGLAARATRSGSHVHREEDVLSPRSRGMGCPSPSLPAWLP